jgi:hypothetical protein
VYVTPVEILRRAVSRRVEETSLRKVAGDVGISKSGLAKFLTGGEPRTSTRRQLERWLFASGIAEVDVLDAMTADLAISILLHDLDQASRGAARSRLLSALEESYSNRGSRPDWLSEISSGLDEAQNA